MGLADKGIGRVTSSWVHLATYGTILATFFAAASAPTPLYRFYQAAFATTPVMMTVVFAVYALALLVALLIAGSLSDHVGRRPVVSGALVLEAGAMVIFVVADSSGLLVAARALQGVATGMACASIGAALADADRMRGPFVNSVAPLAGMAIGASGTSALVQYGPFPLHLVYALLLVAFVAQAAALWLTTETGSLRPGALASLLPRIAVPASARRSLIRVTPINVATWALAGFYLSLVPSLVATTTGSQAPLTGGAIVTLLMLAGATAVTVRRTRTVRDNFKLGIPIIVLGVVTIVAGVHAASVPLLAIGTLLSGVGFGTNFLGTLGFVMPLAKPEERAELLSAFYIQSYLAFSVPAILAGYLVSRFDYTVSTDLYAAVVIALNLLGALGLTKAETPV